MVNHDFPQETLLYLVILPHETCHFPVVHTAVFRGYPLSGEEEVVKYLLECRADVRLVGGSSFAGGQPEKCEESASIYMYLLGLNHGLKLIKVAKHGGIWIDLENMEVSYLTFREVFIIRH